MELDLIELLKFVEKKTEEDVFEQFAEQLEKHFDNPLESIQIKIPSDIVKEFIQSKQT